MSYFKNETKEALAVLAKVQAELKALWKEAAEFSTQFGATPIIATSGTHRHFHSVTFKGGDFYESPGLWTVPDRNFGGSCRPRKKVPATLKEQSKALHELWEKRPKTVVDSEPIYAAVGLNSMIGIFGGGINMTFTPSGIYIETDITPNTDSGTFEILGSEFKAAIKQGREAA